MTKMRTPMNNTDTSGGNVEILKTERVDIARHKRLAINAAASNPTDEELQAVVEQYLRRERVGTVVMFVWSSAELAGQSQFDVARVQICKGNKRWTGAGRWLAGTPKNLPEQVNKLHRERLVIERRETAGTASMLSRPAG